MLFPDPDGPMIAVISPAATSIETPSSARTAVSPVAEDLYQVARG